MFNNRKDKNNGIHYSRYIASWTKISGKYFGDDFMDWLEYVGVDPEEIPEIRELAECGKMELEASIVIWKSKKSSEKETA